MNKGKYYLPSPQIYAKKEMPLIQKCNKGGVRHRMPLKLVSAAWDSWIWEIWGYPQI